MNEFHFLRPFWFLALLPLAAVIIALLRNKARSRSWAAVCDPQLLPWLLAGESGQPHRAWAPWLTALIGTLLIVALAGPVWERLPQPVFRDQSALVIALDLSRSMDAGDLKPQRATRAVHKITDILKQRHSGQVALLVYAGDAFTVTPLSDDRDTILAQLTSLDTAMMPTQGSRADLAVHTATELLQQAGARRGEVLLVTDGVDDDGFEDALAALRKSSHRLSILGAGTADGAPIPLTEGGFLKDRKGAIVIPRLDSKALQQWAQRGGGRFATLRSDDSDIRYLLGEDRSSGLDSAQQAVDLHSDQWREQGPWLIVLALPFALLAFRRGALAVLLVVLLLPTPQPAQALDWSGLWSRPDQQAARAFEQGDAERAAQTFNDPQWKAAAEYRAGDFDAATATLENIETPDALYNRGNALTKSGKLPEAIASYQRALELDPQHEDAKHNLELLQQQQQPPQQQSGQGDDSEEQQSGENSEQNDSPSSEQQTTDAGEQSGDKEQQADSQPSEDEQDKQQNQQKQQQQSESQQANTQPSDQQDASGEDDTLASAETERESDDTTDPATEQWLRRIPDDPGGLLRRKFLYQYQQRGRRAPAGDEAW